MRSLILTLSLALALPLLPSVATANSHNCTQLRQTVINAVPITSRNLPYSSLRCSVVSEVYFLVIRGADTRPAARLDRRLEAIFRREGLLR